MTVFEKYLLLQQSLIMALLAIDRAERWWTQRRRPVRYLGKDGEVTRSFNR